MRDRGVGGGGFSIVHVSANTVESHQYGHQWAKKIGHINGAAVFKRVLYMKMMAVFVRQP